MLMLVKYLLQRGLRSVIASFVKYVCMVYFTSCLLRQMIIYVNASTFARCFVGFFLCYCSIRCRNIRVVVHGNCAKLAEIRH